MSTLNKLRPKTRIKSFERNATPFFWLYFYLQLFQLLDKERMPYLDAVDYVIKNIKKRGENSETT